MRVAVFMSSLLLCFALTASGQVQVEEAGDAGDADLEFANALFLRGMYEEAAERYQAYVDFNPAGPHAATAYYRLAECRYNLKEHEPALDNFSRAVRAGLEGAHRHHALGRQGELLFLLRRFDDAAAALREVAGVGAPEAVESRALYFLGRAQLELDDANAAARVLEKLIIEHPGSPYTPYARLHLADAFLKGGNLERAAAELSAVADTATDEALRIETRFRAAEIYSASGRYQDAAAAFSQLQQEFPNSAYAERAAYRVVYAWYQAGNHAEAAKEARAFLERHPGSAQAPAVKYLLANALYEQEQYAEAHGLYAEVRRAQPGAGIAAQALYKSAWALHFLGRRDEARQAAAAFLEQEHAEHLKGDAAFLLGTVHAAEGNFSDAYQEFRLVAEKYPESEFAAEALYKSAECLAQLDRREEAAEVFERFVAAHPSHPLAEEALLRAGDVEMLGEAFQQAVERYQDVLAGEPSPAVEEETLYRLALTYHNMQDFAESRDAFERLVRKFPQSRHAAEAYLRIGDYLLLEAKEHGQARAAYERSYELSSNGPYAGRAMRGAALSLYEMGEYDQAASRFLTLLEQHPGVSLESDVYAWISERLFEQEDWEGSAKALRALLENPRGFPNLERVHFKLAETLEAAGRGEEARQQYEFTIAAAPNSQLAVDAHYRLGRLFEADGAVEEAVEHYVEAARRNTGEAAAQAWFRLGEIDEAGERYADAALNYMRIALLFAHDELTPESLWRAGRSFEQAGRVEQAARSYEELVTDYPDAPQAAQARERLAQLNQT